MCNVLFFKALDKTSMINVLFTKYVTQEGQKKAKKAQYMSNISRSLSLNETKQVRLMCNRMLESC